MNNYLLYIPSETGKINLVDDVERKYDLWVNIWGNVQCRPKECDDVTHETVYMYPTAYKLFTHSQEKINSYDAICIMCDDVTIKTSTMNKLFDSGLRDNLYLWQASLTKDSVYGWSHTLTQGTGGLRECIFVEEMMPVFSRKGMELCLWTFPESKSGWGLGHLWRHLVGLDRMGIYDGLTATCIRPQSSQNWTIDGVSSLEECKAIRQKYNLF
jgi:hypothetical protein